MLLDDRLPMEIWIEAGIIGRLCRSAVEEALDIVAHRHPLIRASIDICKGIPSWTPGRSRISITWVEPGQTWKILPLSPRQGLGLRIYVVQEENRATIYLQLHHACVDGKGARLFIHDFFSSYGRARGGQTPPLPPLEPERLKRRGRIGQGPTLPTGPGRGLLREILAFLFPWPRPVQPLPRDSQDNPTPGGNLPYSRRILDREQTRRALERVRPREGTFNDLALADLFATLAEWQIASGIQDRRSRLRILMPVDIRELPDRRTPACNRISFAFLTRRLGECGPDLPESIRAETAYIQQHRSELDFLRAI